MYGDDGWYEYRPHPYNQGALEVYYWSMNDDDLQRLDTKTGWIGFLQGNNTHYPESALQTDFSRIRTQMEKVRSDPTTPDTRLSDNPNPLNPATPGTLLQQMTGGLTPRHGCPLHSRVRYFDPSNQRPGIPEGVGALVTELKAESMKLQLVNTDPVNTDPVDTDPCNLFASDSMGMLDGHEISQRSIVAKHSESGSRCRLGWTPR